MPTQEYRCDSDGSFDVHLSFKEDVPVKLPCPGCGTLSRHILRPPAGIFIEGGTGAGRGHAQARKEALWNERASDQQHDPYTQAKAQLTNQDRAEQEHNGARPMKITEEMIQVTAKGIHAGPKKGSTIVEKQLAIQKKRGKVNGISSNASD